MRHHTESNLQQAKIEWEFFYSITIKRTADRFYKAEINGQRIEKHERNNKILGYSIGNIDDAKTIFPTESELLKAVYDQA